MKKALVSPNEPRVDGYRVAMVSGVEFSVAKPLFWVVCDDSVVSDAFWYDPTNQQIKAIPEPSPEPEKPSITPPSGVIPVTEV
jgi:hypothetical protein